MEISLKDCRSGMTSDQLLGVYELSSRRLQRNFRRFYGAAPAFKLRSAGIRIIAEIIQMDFRGLQGYHVSFEGFQSVLGVSEELPGVLGSFSQAFGRASSRVAEPFPSATGSLRVFRRDSRGFYRLSCELQEGCRSVLKHFKEF